MDTIKSIRVMVKSAYAIQKLRIQTGLRLCANFRSQLKDDPDDEELSAEAQELIKELYASYKKLTEGVAKRRTLPKEHGFVGDDVITDFAALVIAHTYFQLEKQEEECFRLLGEALEPIPIYGWLKQQRGVGPAMAGVLIAYFNVHKATTTSKMWAFAGLDVGPGGLARSRRKEHLVEREYVDKNGELKTKMSTTLDPWVQSKLMGALSTSFMRLNSPYRARYYDPYKHRLETDPHRRKGTLLDKKNAIAAGESGDDIWHKKRIHRASLRYMVKMFIADFWEAWRRLEGLPVRPSYHVEKQVGHAAAPKGPDIDKRAGDDKKPETKERDAA